MSAISERYARVAAGLTQRVVAVDPSAWDDPTPCEGWRARDIIRHLVEWVPPFLSGGAGVDIDVAGADVDADPVSAWRALDHGLQQLLDDPDVSARTFSNPNTGEHRLEDAIATFIVGDVLVHTWDLARATGLDEALDPGEVRGMLDGLEPLGDTLSESGHYAPRVTLPDGASEQDRMLALTGRRP